MDDATAKALLVERVVALAQHRADFFSKLIPAPGDPPALAEAKKERLLLKLREWAEDPVLFVRDNAWVADRRNHFGSEAIPSGVSPQGMVPLLLVPKLVAVLREVDALFESGEEWDVFIDKPRQFAVTTTLYGWWLLHKWLFRKSFSWVLGSGKGPDEIDAGGKGKRDDTSLFGRLRMFLDAFMWNLSTPNGDGTRTSVLKFNQHLAPRGNPKYPAARNAIKAWRANLTGLSDSNDSHSYLSRPRWIVHGEEMFPEAEGNWIAGETPGPSFARSKSASGAGIDEFPHCNENVGPDTDRLSLAACAINTRFRMFVGTWPRGGSSGTEMYRKIRAREATTKVIHIHFTDLPVYLFGAHWTCPCGHANAWPHTESTGHDGTARRCDGCLKDVRVTRFMVDSPWLRKAKAKLGNDRVSIASEILNDPEGTVEDRLFNPWRPETGVRPLSMPPKSRLAMLEGFDPGTSALNPACWILAALDVKEMRLQIVGYWMAAESYIEAWCPLMKRWTPEQLGRMKPIYGKRSDTRTFREAFDYSPGFLDMIRRVSERFPAEHGGGLRFPLGMIGGDKYGDHRHMGESPYERLRDYGIDVYQRYSEDREALVRQGVEWSHRVTIDEAVADIRPPGPLGAFPSLREVFEGAKAKPRSPQGAYKFDVDKSDPPNVSHAVDAFLYLVRLLEERVRAVVTADGSWEQESGGRAEPWAYATGL